MSVEPTEDPDEVLNLAELLDVPYAPRMTRRQLRAWTRAVITAPKLTVAPGSSQGLGGITAGTISAEQIVRAALLAPRLNVENVL